MSCNAMSRRCERTPRIAENILSGNANGRRSRPSKALAAISSRRTRTKVVVWETKSTSAIGRRENLDIAMPPNLRKHGSLRKNRSGVFARTKACGAPGGDRGAQLRRLSRAAKKPSRPDMRGVDPRK